MKEKQIGFLYQCLTFKEYKELEKDEESFQSSLELYDDNFIDSVIILSIDEKRFLIPKEEVPKLQKDWEISLMKVAHQDSLLNPVYVTVDENGILNIE